eukprot:TRINITY_DN5087_c0_g1_i1.p1 TRINITY_DN5087_c0_g1~~TRINITY_DN5087_c0_g1_i1.p1  ORF type:complete len:327 (+),score=56.89 TRINITY_DN5087_c0_g1_i1:46-1026(+)
MYWAMLNVKTNAKSVIERNGRYTWIGSYKHTGRDGREMLCAMVAGGGKRQLSQLCEAVHPCGHLALFGVGQNVRNREIREYNVYVIDDHLCGKHEFTKDITVKLTNVTSISDITALQGLCKSWKPVKPSTKEQRRDNKGVVMLQVAMPPDAVLTDTDKKHIAQHLLQETERERHIPSDRLTCWGEDRKSKKGQSKKRNHGVAIYTFYVKYPVEYAHSLVDLNRPVLDAEPFLTEAGTEVYLNTIQLSEKPEAYDTGRPFGMYEGDSAPMSEQSSQQCDTSSTASAQSVEATHPSYSYQRCVCSYSHDPYTYNPFERYYSPIDRVTP